MTIACERGSRLILLEPTLALPSRILLSSSTDQGSEWAGQCEDSAPYGTPVGLGSDLRGERGISSTMPSPVVLKMVNKRLAELTRQYTAIRKGDPRALAIAEELSQVGTVRDEIQRIQEKLGRSGQPPRSLPSESPTLLRRMDKLARQFAETPRGDPGRSEIVNEITRLSFLADSLFKSKNSQ
jgi:hypothetical protein